MARQTPAICRPTSGRTSGLPGIGGATEITAPQFEQNRALWGNPVPQRLQKTAMIDPPSEISNHLNIRK
jgi:hypothetical protein